MTSTTTILAEKVPAEKIEIGDTVARTKKALEAGDGQRVDRIEKSKSGSTIRFIDQAGLGIFAPAWATQVWREAHGPEDEELLKRAEALDLDVDPENYDPQALAETVAFCEQHADALAASDISPQEVGEMPTPDRDALLAPEPREPTPEEGGLPEGGPSSDTRADEAKAELQAEYDALMAKGSERGWSGTESARLETLRKELGIGKPEKKASAPKPTSQRASTRDASQDKAPREGSTLDGVLKVLRAAPAPMKPDEVFAEMKRRKLTGTLKGKTPEATVAAQMAVAAKAGKHGIHRPEKGRYAVHTAS